MNSFRHTLQGLGRGALLAAWMVAGGVGWAKEDKAAGAAGPIPAAATNDVLTPPAVPQSVFVDDPKVGRDPFFPASIRRTGPRAQAVAGTARSAQPARRVASQHLVCRGITGKASRRLALVNGQTLAVGEEAAIRTVDGVVRIRCLEIRERSVVVAVEGENERKELTLRGGV